MKHARETEVAQSVPQMQQHASTPLISLNDKPGPRVKHDESLCTMTLSKMLIEAAGQSRNNIRRILSVV